MEISSRWDADSSTFKKFERLEVLKALKNLNLKKAIGYDKLPSRVLKIVADELATSPTAIFNQCIEQKTWPKAWKMGEWLPVFKKR